MQTCRFPRACVGDFGECAVEFFGIPHLRLIQFPRRKDEKP
jgi:hypothetical protein